jgi:biopolymer transport protein ExbD
MKLNKPHGSSINKLTAKKAMSDINVTPFVDVCLVLLIIFMVVTPLIQDGVPVNLPVTEDPAKTPETDTQLQIAVRNDGTIYLGPLVVRTEQLESELKALYEKDPAREIVVKGDRIVKYGEVLRVLRVCREVGFQDIGLIAQPARQAG